MPDGTAAQDNLELKRKILEFFVNLVIQLFGLSEAEASSLNQTLKAYLDAGKKQATTSNSKPYNFETHSNLTSMVKRANESILNANGEHDLVPNVIVNFICLASQPFARILG